MDLLRAVLELYESASGAAFPNVSMNDVKATLTDHFLRSSVVIDLEAVWKLFQPDEDAELTFLQFWKGMDQLFTLLGVSDAYESNCPITSMRLFRNALLAAAEIEGKYLSYQTVCNAIQNVSSSTNGSDFWKCVLQEMQNGEELDFSLSELSAVVFEFLKHYEDEHDSSLQRIRSTATTQSIGIYEAGNREHLSEQLEDSKVEKNAARLKSSGSAVYGTDRAEIELLQKVYKDVSGALALTASDPHSAKSKVVAQLQDAVEILPKFEDRLENIDETNREMSHRNETLQQENKQMMKELQKVQEQLDNQQKINMDSELLKHSHERLITELKEHIVEMERIEAENKATISTQAEVAKRSESERIIVKEQLENKCKEGELEHRKHLAEKAGLEDRIEDMEKHLLTLEEKYSQSQRDLAAAVQTEKELQNQLHFMDNIQNSGLPDIRIEEQRRLINELNASKDSLDEQLRNRLREIQDCREQIILKDAANYKSEQMIKQLRTLREEAITLLTEHANNAVEQSAGGAFTNTEKQKISFLEKIFLAQNSYIKKLEHFCDDMHKDLCNSSILSYHKLAKKEQSNKNLQQELSQSFEHGYMQDNAELIGEINNRIWNKVSNDSDSNSRSTSSQTSVSSERNPIQKSIQEEASTGRDEAREAAHQDIRVSYRDSLSSFLESGSVPSGRGTKVADGFEIRNRNSDGTNRKVSTVKMRHSQDSNSYDPARASFEKAVLEASLQARGKDRGTRTTVSKVGEKTRKSREEISTTRGSLEFPFSEDRWYPSFSTSASTPKFSFKRSVDSFLKMLMGCGSARTTRWSTDAPLPIEHESASVNAEQGIYESTAVESQQLP